MERGRGPSEANQIRLAQRGEAGESLWQEVGSGRQEVAGRKSGGHVSEVNGRERMRKIQISGGSEEADWPRYPPIPPLQMIGPHKSGPTMKKISR